MYIRKFDWDNKNIKHIEKHNVRVEEVIQVFFDRPIYLGGREETYTAFGITESGRYLFVVFYLKEKGLIRVITARDMNKKEKNYYKKRR